MSVINTEIVSSGQPGPMISSGQNSGIAVEYGELPRSQSGPIPQSELMIQSAPISISGHMPQSAPSIISTTTPRKATTLKKMKNTFKK